MDIHDTLFGSEGSPPPALGGGERPEKSAEAEIEEKGEEEEGGGGERADGPTGAEIEKEEEGHGSRPCVTVEEMGEGFRGGSEKESLRVRELIRQHFSMNGISLSPFRLLLLAVSFLYSSEKGKTEPCGSASFDR